MSEEERLRARAQVRRCRGCTLCDRAPACGWKQGLLLNKHRPDKCGVILQGKCLSDGEGVFAFQEVRKGALERQDMLEIVQTFARATTVLLASESGDVFGVVGVRADEVEDLLTKAQETG